MPSSILRVCRGFTLIELMMVILIIAILAAIAFPSYSRHVVKGNRGEAQSSLQQIQLLQESHRRDNATYAGDAELETILAGLAKADLYEYRIESPSVTGFTVIAEAVGRQAARENSLFSGDCVEMSLEVTLAGVTKAPATCW
jgi:type IV pilus assembly protein PilE